MSWFASTTAEVRRALSNREDFVPEEELNATPGAFAGPAANTVKKAFPELIPGQLTDAPWAKGAENTIGIGVNNTIWVIDPNSLRRGVWVLNATSEEAAKAAKDAGATTQWGFFVRPSEQIPPIAELNAKGLTFWKGFTEAYYKYYPAQDPRPKAKPKTATPTRKRGSASQLGSYDGPSVAKKRQFRYALPRLKTTAIATMRSGIVPPPRRRKGKMNARWK